MVMYLVYVGVFWCNLVYVGVFVCFMYFMYVLCI